MSVDIETLQGLRERMTPGPLRVRTPVVKMEIKGNIHQVLNEDDFPVAFVPAWDNPGPGGVDGTDEAKANAHAVSLVHALIDQRIADAERIARLEVEIKQLRHQIHEASDPDLLWAAMDNVDDMGMSITHFALAASRAIRAALEDKA